MRIAQISTLGTPVRREGSGSIEGLVWLLAEELVRMGHEVTIFAADGSETPDDLVTTLPGPYGTGGAPDDWQLCEWINICRAVEQSADFDVLHSHAYLWGLPLQPLSHAPMVHTLHITPDEDHARLWSMTPGACVTATSHYQWDEFPDLRPSATIHHGVDARQLTFRMQPEDYVCFLGRFIPGKGPLLAIRAAQELGLRLILAGPRNDYYHAYIEPLVDGRQVEYIGHVGGAQRDALLGGAQALLYPIQAPEPFGLVLVEAMMCGTPVAAIRMGAVSEIVDEGVTGFSTETVDRFSQAVREAISLDRRQIRQRAELRFSAERMAADYLQVFSAVAAKNA